MSPGSLSVLPGYLTRALGLILQFYRIWRVEDHTGTFDYGPEDGLHQPPYPEQKPVCCGSLNSDEFGHIQGSHRSHLKNQYS